VGERFQRTEEDDTIVVDEGPQRESGEREFVHVERVGEEGHDDQAPSVALHPRAQLSRHFLQHDRHQLSFRPLEKINSKIN
jgi:hypothetical protein